MNSQSSNSARGHQLDSPSTVIFQQLFFVNELLIINYMNVSRGCRVPSKVFFTAKHLSVFGFFRIDLSKRRGETKKSKSADHITVPRSWLEAAQQRCVFLLPHVRADAGYAVPSYAAHDPPVGEEPRGSVASHAAHASSFGQLHRTRLSAERLPGVGGRSPRRTTLLRPARPSHVFKE